MVVVRAARERTESISAIMLERYIYIQLCAPKVQVKSPSRKYKTQTVTHTHTTSQYTVRTCNTSPDTWGVRIRVLGRRSDTPPTPLPPLHSSRASRKSISQRHCDYILLFGAFYGVIAIVILPSCAALSPT